MRRFPHHSNIRIRWPQIVICALIVMLGAGLAQAQGEGLTRSYAAPDGALAFSYPATWTLQEVRGVVYVSAPGVTVSLLSPDRLASAGLHTLDTPRLLLAGLRLRLGLPAGSLTEFALNGRPAARLDAPSAQGYPGFLLALTLPDGRLAALDARFTGPEGASSEPRVLDLAASVRLPTGYPPRQLPAAADTPGAVLDALESAGLIPAGARLIFVEDRSFRQGQADALFLSLASTKPARDVVMGGTLYFTRGDATAYEACSLGARIVTNANNVVVEYLEVGITGDGTFFYLDQAASMEDSHSGTVFGPVAEGAHSIVLVAQGDSLSVYLDGRRVFDRAPVQTREGSYGIGLISGAAQARCEGRDLWAYALPDVERGTCLISVETATNRRVGPGLTFDAAAPLQPGEQVHAVARHTGADGALWWVLADGTFVSAEVVLAEGDCLHLPQGS